MSQVEKLAELAAIVRRDHGAALFVVGWYCAGESEEALEGLLAAVRELPEGGVWGDHLALYRERWGRVPDRQV